MGIIGVTIWPRGFINILTKVPDPLSRSDSFICVTLKSHIVLIRSESIVGFRCP